MVLLAGKVEQGADDRAGGDLLALAAHRGRGFRLA
jgi:hypothetical protein